LAGVAQMKKKMLRLVVRWDVVTHDDSGEGSALLLAGLGGSGGIKGTYVQAESGVHLRVR
jgi:hypothetical protein